MDLPALSPASCSLRFAFPESVPALGCPLTVLTLHLHARGPAVFLPELL